MLSNRILTGKNEPVRTNDSNYDDDVLEAIKEIQAAKRDGKYYLVHITDDINVHNDLIKLLS